MDVLSTACPGNVLLGVLLYKMDGVDSTSLATNLNNYISMQIEELIKQLAEMLVIDEKDITPETTLDSLGIDSLDRIMLEQTFGDELSEWKTVGDIPHEQAVV